MNNKSHILILIGGLIMTLAFFGVILIILNTYFNNQFIIASLSVFACYIIILTILFLVGLKFAFYFYLFMAFLNCAIVILNLCLCLLVWYIFLPLPYFIAVVPVITAVVFHQYFYNWKYIDLIKIEKELIRSDCLELEKHVFRKNNLANARRINYFGKPAETKKVWSNSLISILGYLSPYILALSFILGKYHLNEVRLLIITVFSTLIFIGFKNLLLPNLAILYIIRKYEIKERATFAIIYEGTR